MTQNNITQSKFAKLVGVSRQYINKLVQNGTLPVNADKSIPKIAGLEIYRQISLNYDDIPNTAANIKYEIKEERYIEDDYYNLTVRSDHFDAGLIFCSGIEFATVYISAPNDSYSVSIVDETDYDQALEEIGSVVDGKFYINDGNYIITKQDLIKLCKAKKKEQAKRFYNKK